jgi:parallel beta-helix repeat protein
MSALGHSIHRASVALDPIHKGEQRMARLGRAGILAVVIVGLALAAGSVEADPVNVNVNCGLGQKISNAVNNNQGPGVVLTVFVTGGTQCNDNITITHDDVTIKGDPALALTSLVVNGLDHTKPTILIDGARRVTIDKLIVTTGKPGILATRGASVTLSNCRVLSNATFGVVSTFNSTTWIHTCNVDSNASFGAIATNGGAVVMTGGTASNNGRAGLLAVRGGVLRIGQDENGSPSTLSTLRVTVNGNHEGGVTASDGSNLILVGSTISNNTGGNGVNVSRTSSARIGVGGNNSAGTADFEWPNTISGNAGNGISVYESSQAHIVGNSVSHSGSNGIAITASSSATIVGNTIGTSAVRGIVVSESSSAHIGIADGFGQTVRGNTITTSTSDGVGVFNSANARLAGNAISTSGGSGLNLFQATASLEGANTVSSSILAGVALGRNGALFQNRLNNDVNIAQDFIHGNTEAGMVLFEGGVAQFNGPITISQNGNRGINANFGSRVSATNTTISNNSGDGVSLSTGSAFVGSAAITGNTGAGVRCFDAESSVSVNANLITGNTGGAVVNCTGF